MDVLAWSQNLTAARAEFARAVDKDGLFRGRTSCRSTSSCRTGPGAWSARGARADGPDALAGQHVTRPDRRRGRAGRRAARRHDRRRGLDVFAPSRCPPVIPPVRAAHGADPAPGLRDRPRRRGVLRGHGGGHRRLAGRRTGPRPASRSGCLIVNPGMPVPECPAGPGAHAGAGRLAAPAARTARGSGRAGREHPQGHGPHRVGADHPGVGDTQDACAVPPRGRVARRGTPVRPAPEPGLVVGPDRRHPGEAEEGARRPGRCC